MGIEYVETPNIDHLMTHGLHFDRAYVTNLVCIPSRVSMFTGKRPSYFGFHVPNGIKYNRVDVKNFVKQNQIVTQLQQAGYETYYGRKDYFGWQDYTFHPKDLGFEVYANSKEYRGVRLCA